MTSSLKAMLGISQAVQDIQLITSGATWTASRTGRYRITAVGAGGSGAVVVNTVTQAYAQGGCAGGLVQKTVTLTAGTSLTISIGAGGAAQTRTTSSGVTSGVAGGNTTVTGTGISLTANGGPGGSCVADATTIVAALTGGTASGGDWSSTGGGQAVRPSGATNASLGGASVGVFTPTGYASAYSSIYNGGSGIGGVGVGGGGGSMGASSGVNGGPGIALTFATSGAGASYAPVGTGFFAYLNGQGGAVGGAGGPGGGGGYGSQANAAAGGIFGGGGSAYRNDSAASVSGGAGGYGGGGGGAINLYTSAGSATSGKGGDGLVVIEYLGA